MKYKKIIINFVNFFINYFIPVFLRDNLFFIGIITFFFYGIDHFKFRLFLTQKLRLLYPSKRDNNKIVDVGELEKIKTSLVEVTYNLDLYLTDKIMLSLFEILQENKSDSILDFYCGSGYLLYYLQRLHFRKLIGVDRHQQESVSNIAYHSILDNKTKFPDKSIDIVICHALSYTPNVTEVIHEIKRLAKKKVIIIVPIMRYFKYNLIPTIHFFPEKHNIIDIMEMERYSCFKVQQNFIYVGEF